MNWFGYKDEFMKVIEHLERAKNPLFSYEIVPPPRGKSFDDIVKVIETLAPLEPPFIDVTAHCASASYHEKPDGSIVKRVFRKRPGTIGICGIIQNKFKIDTVAHILCNGFTREETEDALIELNFLGVHNIMALRGDGLNFVKKHDPDRSANIYASDLIDQVQDIRDGKFIDELTAGRNLDFGVGVAGYPEKHFEAPNLKTDLAYLKQKIEKGGEYIISQMFFKNESYLNFVKHCQQEGIKAPVIPGLKILKSVKQLTALPKHFYMDIPDELVDEVMANPEHVKEIGIRWGVKQCQELLNAGVPCLHFYVMNDAASVLEVVKRLS